MLEIVITPEGMKHLIQENINRTGVSYCLYVHMIKGYTNSCRYCPIIEICTRRLFGVIR